MRYSRMKYPPFHNILPIVKNSIEKVLKEKASIFYLGHGGPISRGNLNYYLSNFLVFCLKLTPQILAQNNSLR